MTDDLADRIVERANEAIAQAEGDPFGSYEDRAWPAVVAALRELATDTSGAVWDPDMDGLDIDRATTQRRQITRLVDDIMQEGHHQ